MYFSWLDFGLHEALYLHVGSAQITFVLVMSESRLSLMLCHGRGLGGKHSMTVTVSDVKHWHEGATGEELFHGGLWD